MAKVEPRTVTPILKIMRNFLLGRSHTNPLRFEDYYAARTQPPPDLPDGPAHKLSANYYYSRDGRREVDMPVLLASSDLKLLKGKEEPSPVTTSTKNTPGAQWKWD